MLVSWLDLLVSRDSKKKISIQRRMRDMILRMDTVEPRKGLCVSKEGRSCIKFNVFSSDLALFFPSHRKGFYRHRFEFVFVDCWCQNVIFSVNRIFGNLFRGVRKLGRGGANSLIVIIWTASRTSQNSKTKVIFSTTQQQHNNRNTQHLHWTCSNARSNPNSKVKINTMPMHDIPTR